MPYHLKYYSETSDWADPQNASYFLRLSDFFSRPFAHIFHTHFVQTLYDLNISYNPSFFTDTEFLHPFFHFFRPTLSPSPHLPLLLSFPTFASFLTFFYFSPHLFLLLSSPPFDALLPRSLPSLFLSLPFLSLLSLPLSSLPFASLLSSLNFSSAFPLHLTGCFSWKRRLKFYS